MSSKEEEFKKADPELVDPSAGLEEEVERVKCLQEAFLSRQSLNRFEF